MTTDFRASLKTKVGSLDRITVGGSTSGLLSILKDHRGILFPYTPTLNINWGANYDSYEFTHSNYPYHTYRNSFPTTIGMNAEFTAQTLAEAHHMLASIRFLQVITKSHFGASETTELAGTPPPVVLFNYLGSYMFKDVPVIARSVGFSLANDVDYVPVEQSFSDFFETGGNEIITVNNNTTYVPAKLDMFIELVPQYNPKKVRDKFNLRDFASGKSLDNGEGFI